MLIMYIDKTTLLTYPMNIMFVNAAEIAYVEMNEEMNGLESRIGCRV